MQEYRDLLWNGKSFWHATSTIFVESIRKTGLGAINPATDLKLLDLLGFLYAEIGKFGIEHPVLNINRKAIEATLEQGNMDFNGLKLNFRHEGAYVAASPIRAAIYASLNKVGSEVLEKCMILLSILIEQRKAPIIPENIDLFDIYSAFGSDPKPIMIEIFDVADKDLVLENGEEASAMIKELREVFPSLPVQQQFEKLQFCNFRLLNPVPPSSLRIYSAEFQGDATSKDFQYYLTRIT